MDWLSSVAAKDVRVKVLIKRYRVIVLMFPRSPAFFLYRFISLPSLILPHLFPSHHLSFSLFPIPPFSVYLPTSVFLHPLPYFPPSLSLSIPRFPPSLPLSPSFPSFSPSINDPLGGASVRVVVEGPRRQCQAESPGTSKRVCLLGTRKFYTPTHCKAEPRLLSWTISVLSC